MKQSIYIEAPVETVFNHFMDPRSDIDLMPIDTEVLEVANRATQHLYIVNPIKSFEERAKSLWDTHPPIGERIRALENIAGQMGLLSEGR